MHNKLTFFLILTLIFSGNICFAETEATDECCEFYTFHLYDSGISTQSYSLEGSIKSALERNLALQVEKYNPELRKTGIESAKAMFDQRINAYANMSDRNAQVVFQQGNTGNTISNRTEAGVGISRLHPSGTKTRLELGTTRTRSHQAANLFSTNLSATIEHPLQRGAGTDVNLVSLRQAELDLLWSEHELSGFVLNLVAQTENRYWHHYLTVQELAIMQASLKIALQHQQNTINRVDAGSTPGSELAAAAAEVAVREEALINAESAMVTTAISLLRTINPDVDNFWQIKPELADEPIMPAAPPDNLEFHLDTAMTLRPELAQAKLLIQKEELEIVHTSNGMLPKLDFFVTLGKTGYATSFSGSNPRTDLSENYDVTAGLVYELNQGRRAAKANRTRAQLNKAMRQQALENLKQLVREDVIKAFIEVNRAARQIKATAATTEQQKEKLRVEEVKFSVGKTTAFQVAQAQRDYTAALLAEAKAAVGYINAIVELHRADGSLLDRRNIIIRPESTELTRIVPLD